MKREIIQIIILCLALIGIWTLNAYLHGAGLLLSIVIGFLSFIVFAVVMWIVNKYLL